jgi:16S rRNA (cytidine1402-2'-O)-methyltransferase
MTTGAAGRLAPGLYVVATPIGAARDITLRALDVLGSADLLAAEDTRTLRKLMALHGLSASGRPVLAYHDRNGAMQRPRLLDALADGRSVALVSEAGTPLISDPGFDLVRAAREAGHAVHAVPGPSAAIAALSVAGLPTDRFFFAGFPPTAAAARRRFLADLATVPGTLVFYESPRRVNALLGALAEQLGADRRAVLVRELTKRFEDVMPGTLASLAADTAGSAPRGEVVLLVDRPGPASAPDAAELRAALAAELAHASRRDAVDAVARRFEVPRREVYRLALQMPDRP